MSSVLSLPLTTPTPPAVDPANDPGGLTGGAPPTYSAPGMGVGGLKRNPQLPQHPLGAYTDSQYEAEAAQLKYEIAQRYNDILQQLGYSDDNGNFVPGQIEIDSNRQKSELARNLGLADEQTTQQAQQQGTLFSGLRGTAQARAEYPFANAIGQLGVDTPKKLSDLYGQAGGLVNEFTVRHNLLLANAAQRAAANLANNQAAGGANVTGVAPPPAGGYSPGGYPTSPMGDIGQTPTGAFAPPPGTQVVDPGFFAIPSSAGLGTPDPSTTPRAASGLPIAY